jgi:two-component system sensor histidine kinase EvgS
MARGSGITQAELLDRFRRSMAQDASQARVAARNGDFAAVASLAHRMKGACLLVGATGFARACTSLARGADAASEVRVAAALALFEREQTGWEAPLP